MPKLVINSGSQGSIEYELKPGVNLIGRGPNNDFRLEDPSVSAAHAEIVVEANCITVKDLRSTNGTFVNRSQIREGFLQPGQLLSLGVVEMTFMADVAANAPGSNDIARTVALPQVGGIKVSRPTMPGQVPAGGFQRPMNYPAPFAPTPSLTTAPTALAPPPASQARPAQAAAPYAAAPAATAAPVATPVEDRTWKNVPMERPEGGVGWRCLGFGLGSAVWAGSVWILLATVMGMNPTPVALPATGLFCGLALRFAARGRSGIAFALMAIGSTLLGGFIGELGQVFAGQKITLNPYNLLALFAAVLGAGILGGFATTARKRARLA